MEEIKKKTVKDFIKQRKTQVKSFKKKQAETDLITNFIDTQQIEQFEKSFLELKNEEIVFYLFSEDFMKATPLLKILQCGNLKKWLSLVFSSIKNSWKVINEKICLQWQKNELIFKDWKNKFTALNRGVIKLILGSKGKDRQQMADIIVKEFISDQNFVSELYRQYLKIDFVKQHFPLNLKTNEDLLELVSILELFYIPLEERIWPQAGCYSSQQFIDLKDSTIKDTIWNTGDFVSAIKQNKLNEKNFELQELHHNFMHQLVLSNDIQSIIQAHKLLSTSQNQQYPKLLKKIYSSFQSNKQTPIDIALKMWKFAQLQPLMKLIDQNPQTIRFSTNSLNFILQNQSLDKLQKEQIISQILSEKFFKRVYIRNGNQGKYFQRKSASSDQLAQVQISIIYDTQTLIQKKYKNSYPLLSYLQQFKENSNLQIVEKLFLNNLLDRKSSKLKILSAITLFCENSQSKIQQDSLEYKQIEQLLYYHTPLLYLIPKIQPSEVSQFLLDRIFFNCPQIFFKKSNDGLGVGVGRHFLVIYLENCQNLSDNSQNNFILSKIFLSKQSERIIDGSKNNFYVNLLKSLNQSNIFQRAKSQFYMIRHVRYYLREYFDSLPVQQLFQSDYFTQLSWQFFKMKMGKKGKNLQKYTIGKDWGLYDADQICKKLAKINLKSYLNKQKQQIPDKQCEQTHQIQEKANIKQDKKEEVDPTKLADIQIIAKILINYQKGIQDEDQQVEQLPYPKFADESVFWFKTRYHQYKSYKSLKKYVQRIKYNFFQQRLLGNITTKIEMSLSEKHLDEKINFLIKQGFDFYFCKRQILAIEKQKTIKPEEMVIHELLHGQMKQVKRSLIKDQNLKRIVERMIQRKLSFMMTLIYCLQDQSNDLDYVRNRKEYELFTRNIEKFILKRSKQSPRIAPQYTYPEQPAEPIPLHTFIKFEKCIKTSDQEQKSTQLSIQSVLNNFFMNLQAKIMVIQHLQYSDFKKSCIMFEQKQQTNQLIKYWQKWHEYVKERFEYNKNIQTALIKVIQKQSISLEQLEQIQDIFNLTFNIQPFIEKYYEMLGQKLILKHHKKRLDLSQMLVKLSTQEVFLIDSLYPHVKNYYYQVIKKMEVEQNYEVLLVYKMEADQKPFNVFMERLKIMKFVKPLIGDKYHKNIQRIFINQLSRMTLQQFSEIIKSIEQSMFVPIADIVKNIEDENKMINLLEYIFQSSKSEHREKFTQTYLLSLMKEDKPKLTMRVLLIVDKKQFKFVINEHKQNHTKRLSTDNMAFYHKCQLHTFRELLDLIKKYFTNPSKYVSQQVIQTKIKQIVSSLVSLHAWDRLQLLLQINDFNNMDVIVSNSFDCIGKSILSNKKSLRTEEQVNHFNLIIDKLFQLYKSFLMLFSEDDFVNAFLCDPFKAFEIMNPKKLTIEAFAICLRAYPQEAKRFLQHNVQVINLIKPDQGYFKQNFPLTPYYYKKFGKNSWMLDLLRVERKILEAFGELHRLDKTMYSLILLDSMDDNFDEFYTQQEIQLKCSKLLSSNNVTSIKKYPQTWFQEYFAKNQIKNLSILTKQLLIELINQGYVKKEHIFKIISTCKLDVINYFCSKYKIQMNLKTIQQIQKDFLDPKYKNNIWEFLSRIDNQGFIINFIEYYNLFEICPVWSYEDILLTNIAIYKRISLLRFLLEYFQKKAGRQLQFVFNKKGRILTYLIFFPQQISVTMNFYEYYFLVKQSQNQCPIFYVSSRFLINNDNFEKQLQNYNFIPQMKRRLEIFHVLCNVPNVNRDINWKSNVLFKHIFQLKDHPQNTNQIEVDISSQAKWLHFLTYLADQKPSLFCQSNIGTLCQTLILYLGASKTKISIDQIGKLYPKQIDIIKKVDKFIKKTVDVSQFVFKIIKKDSQLKALLLKDNFELFMENFQIEFNLISTFDDALLYIKGILTNLKTLQTQKKYRNHLNKFLGLVFAFRQDSYLQSSNYSLYLKKIILEFLLVSFCEGNMFTFDRLCEILNLENHQPSQIFYLAAKKANQVTVRGNLEPLFDIMLWNSIIQQIQQFKLPLNQQIKNFHINKMIEKSLQKLKQDLDKNFNIKIQNLSEIVNQSVNKVEGNKKPNILQLITVLINETYILSNCYELHHYLKNETKRQQSIELQKQKENQNSTELQKHQSSRGSIYIFFDTEKFDLSISPQANDEMHITIPFNWINAHFDIPLINFDVTDTLKRAQKYILLHKLALNPNIDVLNKMFQNNLTDTSFKNHKFIFNVDSLNKLKKGESLKKIVQYLPMSDSGILQIEKILNQVNDKAFNDKSIPYYSFSDVYGPVKLSQTQNCQKLVDCLSFYELLQLPIKDVIVEVIQAQPSESQINQRCIQDFFQYINYVSNQVKDTHPADLAYNFSSKIQLFINEETLRIFTYTHEFSLVNILKCLSLVNASSDERRRVFENKIDIRYDVFSILKVFQKLSEVSIDTFGKQQSLQVFKFLSLFLRNKKTINLVDKILLLIIEDAINIMKVLKGALITFTINKKKQQNSVDKKYWLNQRISANQISYEIQDQILKITIDVDIKAEKQNLSNFTSMEQTQLVSRSNFFSSIFSSTEFLTDYFLQKGVIDTQCIKISRLLSQKLNTTLNVHINYKSLYVFIDSIKNELPIKQIDSYLYTLRMHLLANLYSKLLQHFTSPQIYEAHQALLINTFHSLYYQSLQNKNLHLNAQKLQKSVEELENNQILCFNCLDGVQQTPLRAIEGYGQQVDNFSSFGQNVFLIQVYKNYFTTLVNEGMTFVIGFKENGKSPALIKFVKRQDINKISINQVSYLLLVSRSIPSNDELDHEKVIRIFVTDMYKNVYLIANVVKNYLLRLQGDDDELRNINNLVPAIPKNIGIDFVDNKKKIESHLKLPSNRGLKTFEIELTKSPKFKIIPTKSHPMNLCNYLRKDCQLNKQIRAFMNQIKIQWNASQIKLIVDSFKIETVGLNYQKIAQYLKNCLLDLQQALSFYLEKCNTNPELDCYLSIYQSDKVIVKDNNTLRRRKLSFLKQFKQIKFILADIEYPKIKIIGQEIQFQLSTNVKQYLKSKQIFYRIVETILQRKIKQSHCKVIIKEQLRAELNAIQIIKCIDLIDTIDFNLKELQKAKDIFRIIRGESLKEPLETVFELANYKKTYIELRSDNNGKYIAFCFNISNPQSDFFTASKLLTIMLNNFVDSNKESTFDTNYDPLIESINVYGEITNQYTLVIDSKQHPQVLTQSIIQTNNKTGSISIKQKLKLSQSKNFRYFLVNLQNNQVHENYVYQINPLKDQKIIDQKVTSISIDQIIDIYVMQTKEYEVINLQKLPITVSFQQPNGKDAHNYQNLMKKDILKHVQIKLISRQLAKLSFTFNKAYNVSIKLGGYKNIFDSLNKDTYQIIVSSNQQAVIENTKFIEVHFRNKIHQSKEIKLIDKKVLQKKIFSQPVEKQTFIEEKQILKQNNKNVNDIESLVYVVNNESKDYLTRAGQNRVDYIQICDADFNPVEYKEDINIYFKHINNLCKIVPQIGKIGLKVGLSWTPTIRGHYKAYFNGICLNPDYEIGVCAAVVDPLFSTVQKPKVKKICFFEETECTLNLKDCFKNIYTELQQNILGDELIIEIKNQNQNIKKYIKKKQEPINKYGVKRVRFSIDDNGSNEPIKTIFSVLLNKQKMCEFEILIEGQSLTQRRKQLQKDLNYLNKGYLKEINVSRSNFLEDLFKIAEKSLFTNFSVKFNGQMGIDAGGLKREFYDMIGSQIKSDQNPFFKPTDSRKMFYFINPEILKNKKKQAYMELFGKYLANSILNGYLIGVNFSSVFIKLLYKDPVEFQDLLQVLPEDQARTYKYLTTAPPDDFEDLQIYFSVIVDKKKGLQVQLKENGSHIQVTHKNVKQYLDLLTKVLVKNRYEQVLQAFRKGFESVISLNLLMKWIRPHQFWCLTQGTKEINAQMVLNYVTFSGITDQSIISWFRRFINESSMQVLEGFLKFASGSSSIDFDQTSKITVTFQNAGQNSKKLPISHTCWKEIVVPKYKSYEILQKLLNAAFIYCSEGFGFG